MTILRHALAWLEGRRADLAMALFGSSSSWDYCHRCWRKGDYRRPLHDAVQEHPSMLRRDFCEPCTTILGVREWPCSNCGMSDHDFRTYILHREGLVRA